jgi:hypothetical protein
MPGSWSGFPSGQNEPCRQATETSGAFDLSSENRICLIGLVSLPQEPSPSFVVAVSLGLLGGKEQRSAHFSGPSAVMGFLVFGAQSEDEFGTIVQQYLARFACLDVSEAWACT